MRASWRLRLLLVLGSTVVALGFSAAVLSLVAPSPSAPWEMRFRGKRVLHARFDPRLGWANAEPDGLRPNGQPRPPGPPILALGDSFTWGSEVGPRDTWPAQLEKMLGRPVLNAGVNGYGVDQIYLAALEGIAKWHPVDVVVAVIPNDVMRCGCSVFLKPKPWFVSQGAGLSLQGWPVLRDVEPSYGRPMNWAGAAGRCENDGREVAARLVDCFATLRPRPILVLVTNPRDDLSLLVPLRRHALTYPDFKIVDLTESLPRRLDLFDHPHDIAAHCNAAGYGMIARHLCFVIQSVPSVRDLE